MILGQTLNADPVHIRDILIVLAFLISSGVAVMSVVIQAQSQKRQVTFGPEFVTAKDNAISNLTIKERVDKLEAQVAEIRKEMHVMGTMLNAGDEHRSSEIHKRINMLAEELPARVISLLRNTGMVK